VTINVPPLTAGGAAEDAGVVVGVIAVFVGAAARVEVVAEAMTDAVVGAVMNAVVVVAWTTTASPQAERATAVSTAIAAPDPRTVSRR
jgi:hypothetical protein